MLGVVLRKCDYRVAGSLNIGVFELGFVPMRYLERLATFLLED